MTTIDLFPNEIKEEEKKQIPFSLKPLLKKAIPACAIFVLASILFSTILCKMSSNNAQLHFERLEELIEDIELAGELTDEHKVSLVKITAACSDCLPTCSYLRSFDPSYDILKTQPLSSSRSSEQTQAISPLKRAFALLESISYFRSKNEKKKVLETQNDLKKTLDHKSFATDKRTTFKAYLKSMNIKI